jgi:hypothetical protein
VKSLLVLALCLTACSALVRPGGPTDDAYRAGVANISASLDTNHDGVVSTDEIKTGVTAGVVSRDWESLSWIVALLLGGGGGAAVAGPLAHKAGKRSVTAPKVA